MRELVFYLLAAISSLFVLGYSVHMFVTGLVSVETERLLIVGACLAGVLAIGFMAWDVLRRRKCRQK